MKITIDTELMTQQRCEDLITALEGLAEYYKSGADVLFVEATEGMKPKRQKRAGRPKGSKNKAK